ncbi:MAG: hypothetical protein R3313_03210, partial [Candidatus Saccharimonadales bacterium]|nr:hypothetical protein [Candidatus Saccharimonadales bacterium]
ISIDFFAFYGSLIPMSEQHSDKKSKLENFTLFYEELPSHSKEFSETSKSIKTASPVNRDQRISRRRK